MFKTGDVVYDRERGRYVKIIEIRELWGYRTYDVYDPVDKEIYSTADDYIGYGDNDDFNLYAFKYIVTAARIKNEMAANILSPVGNNIMPLPHQIYALNRALSGDRIRYLLADEVGLGKTIEAGLIIKELKLRGLIRRILIVCPKGLITQWHQEMKHKFDEDFNVVLPQDFDAIRRLYGDGNVWRRFDQVICPVDSVKPLKRRQGWSKEQVDEYNKERIADLVAAGWDMVIIDEAHRLGGSTSDVARYRLGKLLSEASPYLLLLTATPHQGKTGSFLRLIRLLDKDAFPDENAVVKEQVAPYIIRTEKREAVDKNGNPLFKKRITRTMDISWDVRHSLQRELYERVTEYVAHGYNRARREKRYYIGFLMVLMQRLVTSSTRAIRVNLEKRLEILKSGDTGAPEMDDEDFWEEDAQEALDDLIGADIRDVKNEVKEIQDLLIIARQAENQYVDAKAEVLIDLINRLQAEMAEDFKAIVFTEFVATQEFLREYLQEKGFSVVILNGSMSMDERDKALREFKEKADILVSTDAGGEGLNLQFCHVVINYDLPWNPMKIEQRIGRVDRIGQKSDVQVYNFMLSDTVEFRVREVLEEKLKTIAEQFGVDKWGDILDTVQAEMDFTELYMNSIVDPRDIGYRVDVMERKIKEKTEKISSIKELIKDDKVLDESVVKKLAGTQLQNWIKQMYINKTLADGGEVNLFLLEDDDFFSLSNEVIKRMLGDLPLYIKKDKVPALRIDNSSNEKGYWTLWEVSINENRPDYKQFFPLFINDNGVVRIPSSRLLWDVFVNEKDNLNFTGYREMDDEMYHMIWERAKDVAYNVFDKMKTRYLEELDREKKKYEYAFKLRKEAAGRIGLEAVRRFRLKEIEKEETSWRNKMQKSSILMPALNPVYMVYLE
ncbi:DEAD/DEAH box helicase [Caldanaerobius polysaccharolyticus]|uniref:DEAD/DEAH box helicase n=1 Tax=Caldanaerobius polysaccharolyticus TaxID=44256 RepID=UPI00047B6A37|nr:helicase-related protein [Caldanaerobius polysaccharolyticus]